jgi:hypothetical protein
MSGGLVPLLRQLPNFRGYYLHDGEHDGRGKTVYPLRLLVKRHGDRTFRAKRAVAADVTDQERRDNRPLFVRRQTADHSQPPCREVGLESHCPTPRQSPGEKDRK